MIAARALAAAVKKYSKLGWGDGAPLFDGRRFDYNESMATKKKKSVKKIVSKAKDAAKKVAKKVGKPAGKKVAKKVAKKAAKPAQGLLGKIVQRSAQLVIDSGLLGELPPETSSKRKPAKKRAKKA